MGRRRNVQITIGCDVGQRVDPTAIVVTEQQWREGKLLLPGDRAYDDHYIVRHMERLPLGTKYPLVVERIAEISYSVEERVRAGTLVNRAGWLEPTDYAEVKLYVDATGVGQPVVDELKKAGVRVTGVYFTHGDRRLERKNVTSGEIEIVLGKAYLVARLQAKLQTFRVHLPKTEEARALAQELLDYEIRVDERANDRYGAFRVGSHDDLVTALGLSMNKPPQYLSAASSAPGSVIQAVPSWAGGQGVPVLGKGNNVELDRPGFRGLNNWGADGGNGIGRLR